MMVTSSAFLAIVLAFSVGLLRGTTAHVFRVGACPPIQVVEGFSYAKFQGRWYAIEKSQTASSCMYYNFTTKDDGSLEVQEKYRLFGIKIFDWSDIIQVGRLTTLSSDSPAKMLVQFPFSLNPLTAISFWVISTDYDQYAAIWSCRPFLFGHFQSGMILARNRTLDRAIVNKMRSRFEFFGVDAYDFTTIDQTACDDDDHLPVTDLPILKDCVNAGLQPEEVTSTETVINETISTEEPSTSTEILQLDNSLIDENIP